MRRRRTARSPRTAQRRWARRTPIPGELALASVKVTATSDSLSHAPDIPEEVRRPRLTSPPTQVTGVLIVLASITGLSFNSTIAKSARLPGPVFAFWRMFFASIVWVVIVAVRRERFTRAEILKVLPAGILFGANICLFLSGVQRTRIANAEFLGTLTPLLVVPYAAMRLDERVRKQTLALGAIGLCGVSLIVYNSPSGGTHRWSGDLMILGAISLWATYLVITRPIRAALGTAKFMAGMSCAAVLTVAPIALVHGGVTDLHWPKSWILVFTSAMVAGVISHGTLAWSQKRVAVSVISLLGLAQPGLGTTWGWVFLHEGIKRIQFGGMVLVLACVGLIAHRESR
jgi:drug/metabolite transporter (DMT)-like permease